MAADASITMGEFADPELEIRDPRQEAAQSMANVKEAVGALLKTVGSIGKMTNYAFLKLLHMRRDQFIEATDRSRVAREMIKRLKPSPRYLFGDQIRTVCRSLKDGSQLSLQLQVKRINARRN